MSICKPIGDKCIPIKLTDSFMSPLPLEDKIPYGKNPIIRSLVAEYLTPAATQAQKLLAVAGPYQIESRKSFFIDIQNKKVNIGGFMVVGMALGYGIGSLLDWRKGPKIVTEWKQEGCFSLPKEVRKREYRSVLYGGMGAVAGALVAVGFHYIGGYKLEWW